MLKSDYRIIKNTSPVQGFRLFPRLFNRIYEKPTLRSTRNNFIHYLAELLLLPRSGSISANQTSIQALNHRAVKESVRRIRPKQLGLN